MNERLAVHLCRELHSMEYEKNTILKGIVCVCLSRVLNKDGFAERKRRTEVFELL